MRTPSKCSLCELGIAQRSIHGSGDVNADIMFIVDNPNYYEAKNGMILSGDTGEKFNKLLKMISLDRKDVYVTSLVKCRSVNTLKRKNVIACKPYLLDEIASVHPRIVVTMGTTVFKEITGHTDPISNHLNTAIRTKRGNFIIPMYNLNYIFKDARNHGHALNSFINLYKLYRKFVNPAIANRESELDPLIKKYLKL